MDCPFCDEEGFDRIGLWFHLNAYPCDGYEQAGKDYQSNRADLAIEAARRRKEK